MRDHDIETTRGQAERKVPGLDAPATEGGPAVRDCPLYFEAALRDHWFAISGQWYFVDSAGRPAGAVAVLPPVFADDPRDEQCQREVGRWGDEERTGADYDGGHMIGHQLGGWGARANLVPQQTSFNRGNWAQVENALARCGALTPGRLRYTVAVDYPHSAALVPSRMTVRLEDAATGDVLHLSFENAPAGGHAGASQQRLAVDWLRALGCR